VGRARNIGELAAVLDYLQVAPVAKEIEELLAQQDRLEAMVSEALGAFDARGGWAEDGSLSLSARSSAKLGPRYRHYGQVAGEPGRSGQGDGVAEGIDVPIGAGHVIAVVVPGQGDPYDVIDGDPLPGQ
jgi:hypothetical protein